MNNLKRGFTLIELLIVIAILGTLAVVVLLALNPVQQLARTRDSGRISAVTQLGHAVEAYATSRNGVYLPENATWIDTLVTAGEIGTVPTAINYTAGTATACGVNQEVNLCYDATTAAGGAPVVVFARLESNSQNSKCNGSSANCTNSGTAYTAYSTAAGRGGIVCAVPSPGVTAFCE
jgi:prepilin-type N-terminal cleavage/methylation domain-containing protein